MLHDAQLTPEQFAQLCADLWRDRNELAQLNPALDARQLALWLLYGSLQSLLSLPEDYSPAFDESDKDFYAAAVRGLLREQFSAPENYLNILENWLARYGT